METKPETHPDPVRWLAAPEGWSAALLKVQALPMSAEDVAAAKPFFTKLQSRLIDEERLKLHVLLQFNQLHQGSAANDVSAKTRDWLPMAGLGIFPDQPPPTGWTPDDFTNLEIGEMPRPLMHPLLRLDAEAPKRREALNQMLGTASLVHYYVQSPEEGLYTAWTELLLPPIQDPIFFGFPFYFPLLNCRSIESATTDDLERWLLGKGVYVRESAEDSGTLLVWPKERNAAFASLGLVASRRVESLP